MSCRTVKDEHNVVGIVASSLLDSPLYFGELVHKSYLIVKSACSVDDDDIGSVGLGRADRVVCHAGRVASHLLLDDGHSYPLAPDAYLLYGSGTESVSSTKVHLVSCLLELVGEFADGSGLSHSVDTHHEYDVGFMSCRREAESLSVSAIVFCQQRCYLLAQNLVELVRTDILISGHTFFYAAYDLKRCVHTDIAGDKNLLEIVEHFFVYFRLSRYGSRNLAKHTFLCLSQSVVKCFFLLFGKKIKESHNAYVL